MLVFILKRIGLAIPTLLVVSLLVFFAAHMAPSDPVETRLGEKATAEQRQKMRHDYGLDLPIPVQYVRYVGGILHGDFGLSFARDGAPVSQMIAEKFPVTMQLAVTALLFSTCLGIPIGAVAAYYHNTWFDRLTMAFVVALVSVPSIVLGPLLVLVVAVQWRVLPVSGWDTPWHVILPTIALGSRSAAIVARFMRASLLETLRQDYIRTAVAKGLSRPMAVLKHGIKNAFLPVLTVLGTNFGALLTGSFVVESIFQVPGIGFISIQSITGRDYPVIEGMALLVAAIYLTVNLGVDLLYGFIDPRVRASEAKEGA